MNDPREISVTRFDYGLPPEKIARYPLPQRDASKLLVWKNGIISDDRFLNAADHLPANAFLVLNQSRVIQARLKFKGTKGEIEIFCLEPASRDESATGQGHAVWSCLVGRLKNWKEETLCLEKGDYSLRAQVAEKKPDHVRVDFTWTPANAGFEEVLEVFGATPVPPYLEREAEQVDRERYQTVYATEAGSVAAPTAGLHFTKEVMDQLQARGHETGYLNLHVGSGTFRPVKSHRLGDHEMHGEWVSVSRELVQRLISNLGRIIAVGTTTMRALESLYWLGLRIEQLSSSETYKVSQWEPYDYTGPHLQSNIVMENILRFMDERAVSTLTFRTNILIAPPYRLKVVSGLFTNFHQPRSTLLLLIAAVAGDRWREIYDHALSGGYRFLSYGDSSLLLP